MQGTKELHYIQGWNLNLGSTSKAQAQRLYNLETLKLSTSLALVTKTHRAFLKQEVPKQCQNFFTKTYLQLLHSCQLKNACRPHLLKLGSTHTGL